MPGPCISQPSPSLNFPSSYIILSESSEPWANHQSSPEPCLLVKNSKGVVHHRKRHLSGQRKGAGPRHDFTGRPCQRLRSPPPSPTQALGPHRPPAGRACRLQAPSGPSLRYLLLSSKEPSRQRSGCLPFPGESTEAEVKEAAGATWPVGGVSGGGGGVERQLWGHVELLPERMNRHRLWK